MPSRRQVHRRTANPPLFVAPLQIHRQSGVGIGGTETKVKLLTALSRVTIAAVDLAHQAPSVRQSNDGSSSNGCAPIVSGFRRSHVNPQDSTRLGLNREKEIKPQNGMRSGAIVPEVVGGSPLVGNHEIQVAIPFCISYSNPATKPHFVVDSQFRGDVMKSPIR